jgi:predicted nucleic acid-binding protein
MLPSRAVVDASVAYKWLFWEEDSARANRLQASRLLAPELLDAECANILWRKARQQIIAREDAVLGMARLRATPVIRMSHRQILDQALAIALELDHPVYDCLYLALAYQEGVPLVTADRGLVAAAGAQATYADRVLPLADIPLA